MRSFQYGRINLFQFFAIHFKNELLGRINLQAEYGQRRGLDVKHRALVSTDVSLTPNYSAQFSASVAPEVNTTFSALASNAAPIRSRASSIIARMRRPTLCTEDALPPAASARDIATAASARIGAPAL